MTAKTITFARALTAGRPEPITAVTLREPASGDLRGLKLTDVMQMDVAAMTRLIPRLTTPALAPSEVEALGPADFMALCTGIVGFFFTAEQIEAETARMN